MVYQFEFRPYQQKFKQALATSHGIWENRDGIVLRLTDATGRVGWGEIAPISWFGSETLEQALAFCHQLPTKITDETIFSIPDELPACQFGFESAREWGIGNREWGTRGPHSLLLPSGKAALETWQLLWNQGYSTFKWKIGVHSIQEELRIFSSLTQALPTSAKLRLDANGGLSYDEACLWLLSCDRANYELPLEIEFIEQPLKVDQFEGMLELSRCYETAIALDESVATLNQLITCYHKGWRGIFVIKPGIVGSPSRLRQFCQQYDIDAVFSSVFETAIGRHAALQLAAELSRSHRAVGFGTNHFFVQEEENWLQDLWKKF